MRDKSHNEQIERWAEFVRENPGKWKIKLKDFLDSQIIMARRFYKKLLESDEGKDIIQRLKQEKIKI
jgi:hypothetical protein